MKFYFFLRFETYSNSNFMSHGLQPWIENRLGKCWLHFRDIENFFYPIQKYPISKFEKLMWSLKQIRKFIQTESPYIRLTFKFKAFMSGILDIEKALKILGLQFSVSYIREELISHDHIHGYYCIYIIFQKLVWENSPFITFATPLLALAHNATTL